MGDVTVIERDPDIRRNRVLARLPSKARSKLQRWLEQETDFAALRRADAERLMELQAEKGRAQRELAELQRFDERGLLHRDKQVPDDKSSTGFRTERVHDTARLEAAKGAVDRLQDQIDRLRARAIEQAINPTTHLIEYVGRLRPDIALSEHVAPPAKRERNETWEDAIERIRASMRELEVEAHAVELAPSPSPLGKEKIRRLIEQMAARGEPSALSLVERTGSSIEWPTVGFPDVQTRTNFILQVPDMLSVLCWLLPEEMQARLEVVVDKASDDDRALTDPQRKARLNEIEQGLLQLGYDEESFIEQAEHDGIKVLRRHDADPRCVLSLSPSLPNPEKRG